jgi:hypothetical protein
MKPQQTITPTSKRAPPTVEQIRAEQTRQAEAADARKAALPVKPAGATLAVPAPITAPALTSTDDYFDRNPSRMVVGQAIRPNLKLGQWVLADSADPPTPLPDGGEYVVIYDATWAGWVRLEADQPPQYDGGLLFSADYHRHSREELGDRDPTYWSRSQFDGQPQDPWREAVYLPIEQAPTGAMFTIQIQSNPRSAAIFAIDGLLSDCRQRARRDPENYPIIQLVINSYKSRKFGMQFKPVFRVVGKTPKAGHAAADASSLSADMSDGIPF